MPFKDIFLFSITSGGNNFWKKIGKGKFSSAEGDQVSRKAEENE